MTTAPVPGRFDRHLERPALRHQPSGSTLEVIVHLALALSAHERRARAEGTTLPNVVTDLTQILLECARVRQGASPVDAVRTGINDPAVTSPLLVSKGDAARLLSVSLRTVDRLISSGRLPVIHIDGASRIRLADLSSYVERLAEESGAVAHQAVSHSDNSAGSTRP